LVPNPNGQLLPGMFVRARIDEGTLPNALLVPQRAVTRDQNARPTTLVVDASGKVDRRLLETDRAIGDSWLVTKGIASGERVIVEGLQKARPGATVKAVPAGGATGAPDGAETAAASGSASPTAAPTGSSSPTAAPTGSASPSAAPTGSTSPTATGTPATTSPPAGPTGSGGSAAAFAPMSAAPPARTGP
jgi:hypothetical protein